MTHVTLYHDQTALVEQVRNSMRSQKNILVQAATGFGKCLGYGTPVMMHDGTVKSVQDIVNGDLVMGHDGLARLVSGVTTGREMLYRITPTKGDSWVCNESHILSLKRTNKTMSIGVNGYESRSKPKGHIENVSVKDYLSKSKTFKHIYKQWRVGVDFNGSIPTNYPSPYFLGIWLGDGSERSTEITTVDNEIVWACVDEAIRFDASVKIYSNEGKCNIYAITTDKGIKNKLLDAMRDIGVIYNKHIPHIYKTANKNDRISLLAGLIDSDGHVAKGGVEITQKRKNLADDICFLARSLGFAAYIKEVKKTCYNNGVTGTYYRVGISGDLSSIPTRLKRKKVDARNQKKDILVTGITVTPIGVGDYYGFELIGNDSLFLLGDFTVTHNTRIAAHMIDRIRLKGNRVGFMVPRRELLRQTAETMDSLDIPHGFIASGWPINPFAKVQLITSGTIARRLDNAPKLDVLFVDECHFGGAELDRIIRHYQSQGTWLIGLSATPMKTSGQGMGDWYDTMVKGPSIRWLMDNKRLSDYRLFAPDRPDLSAIKTVAGDYAKCQLSDYMEQDRVLIGNAAKHYKSHAMGRLNVVFCTSIKHAEITAGVFKDAGIPSAYVHGKMDDKDIANTVMAFARREILALCSVDLLTFGFDLSQAARMDVTVECLSDLRPTKSLPLQMQKIGRALRMKDYPAIIFDHAGNSQIHGLPDADREWTLEGRDKKKRGEQEKTEPTRQCGECYFVHRPAPVCPNCGCAYPVIGREIEEVEGELVEVTEAPKVNVKQEIGIIARTEGVDGLMRYAKLHGYKNPYGWVAKQMSVRGLRG